MMLRRRGLNFARLMILMGGRGASAPIPWYLSGGIPAANCIAAYQPIGAASYAASKVNLAKPGTYDAADGVAYPTWAAETGWTFNGTSQYLTTEYIPPNSVARTGIVSISEAATDAAFRTVFCSRNSSMIFGARNTSTTQAAVFHNGTNTYIHSAAIATGVMAVAGLDAYLDGLDVGNITAGTYDPGVVAIHIGQITTGGQYFKGNVLAIAIYDIALTPTQVAAVTTALGE